MTLYNFEDGTIEPWSSRTGENVVENVPKFGHNGLKLIGTTYHQTQEIFIDHIGEYTKHDLRFYYNFQDQYFHLRFKPFSAGNNFTSDGYYAEVYVDPGAYDGINFSIKKIKNGVTTTLWTENRYQGIEFPDDPNLLSIKRDYETGLMTLYYNNNIIGSVIDTENFDSEYIIIQKNTFNNYPCYIDYVDSNAPISYLEDHVLMNWEDNTLNDWKQVNGYRGVWYKELDFDTADGIRIGALWDHISVEKLFNAIEGEFRFGFVNLNPSGYQSSTSFYPLLDYFGNGYKIRYGSEAGTYQSEYPNTLKLYKVINGIETEIASKIIHSNHEYHILTFRKILNQILIKLDNIIEIRTSDNTPFYPTRIKLRADEGINKSASWFGFVEYTPLTYKATNLKSLIDIPYKADIRTLMCIKNLNYDILTKLTITHGSKEKNIKTILFINEKLTGHYSNNLKSLLSINAGAKASDISTILLLGISYQKRLRIQGRIIYAPRTEKPPTIPDLPEPENYPEDYGNAETIEEENGISIIIGGETYL
jgi:hypothetical protein